MPPPAATAVHDGTQYTAVRSSCSTVDTSTAAPAPAATEGGRRSPTWRRRPRPGFEGQAETTQGEETAAAGASVRRAYVFMGLAQSCATGAMSGARCCWLAADWPRFDISGQKVTESEVVVQIRTSW